MWMKSLSEAAGPFSGLDRLVRKLIEAHNGFVEILTAKQGAILRVGLTFQG
jgi:hypothetical protein